MQYTKEASDSNYLENGNKNIGSPMLRLVLKPAAFVLVVLPVLALAGCSDTLTAGQSDTSFATSSKSYDKTLTPEQRKAAISDLQTAQAKRQVEATAQGDAAASPHPAQSQN